MNKLSSFRRAAGLSSKSDSPETPPSDHVAEPTPAETSTDAIEPNPVEAPSAEAVTNDQAVEPVASDPAPVAPVSEDTPTTEAKASKRGKRTGTPKTRIIVMVEGDVAEIVSTFKLSNSAVCRAVVSGARDYLASLEGELTEVDLTAKIRALLS